MHCVCGKERYKEDFTQGEWEHARCNNGRGKCRICLERSECGKWYCKGCRTKKDKIEFSQWIMMNGQKQNSTARCDICKDKHEADNECMRQFKKAMIVPSSIQLSLKTQTHMHEQFSGEPLVQIFVSVVMERT